MIPVKVDIIPKAKRPGYNMVPEFIAIHQTGNTGSGANAAMHNKYCIMQHQTRHGITLSMIMKHISPAFRRKRLARRGRGEWHGEP